MSLHTKLIAFGMKRRGKPLSATKVIAVTFAVIILMGTILLSLPAASRSGVSCGIRPALFVATSATCVTGLTLFDTYVQWSAFGQAVILCLIEIGGLGFMSAATMVVFLLRRKIGLRQRMVMAQALSLNDMDGVVRLQKVVLTGSIAIQSIGACLLTLYFWPRFGFLRSLRWGVFHAVSAFCNAGFDIFGALEPGSSLGVFREEPFVLLVLGALVVVGGLGFLVWEEIEEGKFFRKMSVYAKLVLCTTFALLLTGWVLTCLLEWNNPRTLGSLSLGGKLVNGLFQSITLRTAGFAAIDQGGLTDAGKAMSMVLMLVGGSSGSTAGGLKTVTFVVMLLFLASRARGREYVTVFHRTIPNSQVLDAMTISLLMISLTFFGAGFICATGPGIRFADALFETTSALATVGLTTGVTPVLSIPAQFLIILYMYFGRVGILTISLGFLMGDRAQERFHYAETKLLIG